MINFLDICLIFKIKMNNKPSIPKGTRDFSPNVMRKRNYVFEKDEKSF